MINISNNKIEKAQNGLMSLHADGITIGNRLHAITMTGEAEQRQRTIDRHLRFLANKGRYFSNVLNISYREYDVAGTAYYQITANDVQSERALEIFANYLAIFEDTKSLCIEENLKWLAENHPPMMYSIDEYIAGI